MEEGQVDELMRIVRGEFVESTQKITFFEEQVEQAESFSLR